jgi:hypothetical protein
MKEIIKLSLIEGLINEGRLEDVKAKWAGKGTEGSIDNLNLSHKNLNEDDIDFLSQEDPSGNNKYLGWMVGLMNLDMSEWENKYLDRSEVYMGDIIKAVKGYHENLARINNKLSTSVIEKFGDSFTDREKKRVANNPKDINSFESLVSLNTIVEEAEELKKDSPLRDKIYEDDRFIVVVPKTHKASCKYGAFSNWCVSTSNTNYFNQYTQGRGMLAFIIWKDEMGKYDNRTNSNDTIYKLAIHIEFNRPTINSWTFWNKRDHQMDNTTMRNVFPPKLLNAVDKYKDKLMWEKGIYTKLDWESIGTRMKPLVTQENWGMYITIGDTTLEEYWKNNVDTRADFYDYSPDKINIFNVSNRDNLSSTRITTYSPQRVYSSIKNSSRPFPTVSDITSNVSSNPSPIESLDITQEELNIEYILPLLLTEYTEEQLKTVDERDNWQDVRDRWGTINTSDLNIGDIVKWEITTGGGYRRSDWGYNHRQTNYFEGEIIRQTPTGYNIVQQEDGTTKRFKTVGDKYMYVKKDNSKSVWDILHGETSE